LPELAELMLYRLRVRRGYAGLVVLAAVALCVGQGKVGGKCAKGSGA